MPRDLYRNSTNGMLSSGPQAGFSWGKPNSSLDNGQFEKEGRIKHPCIDQGCKKQTAESRSEGCTLDTLIPGCGFLFASTFSNRGCCTGFTRDRCPPPPFSFLGDNQSIQGQFHRIGKSIIKSAFAKFQIRADVYFSNCSASAASESVVWQRETKKQKVADIKKKCCERDTHVTRDPGPHFRLSSFA